MRRAALLLVAVLGLAVHTDTVTWAGSFEPNQLHEYDSYFTISGQIGNAENEIFIIRARISDPKRPNQFYTDPTVIFQTQPGGVFVDVRIGLPADDKPRDIHLFLDDENILIAKINTSEVLREKRKKNSEKKGKTKSGKVHGKTKKEKKAGREDVLKPLPYSTEYRHCRSCNEQNPPISSQQHPYHNGPDLHIVHEVQYAEQNDKIRKCTGYCRDVESAEDKSRRAIPAPDRRSDQNRANRSNKESKAREPRPYRIPGPTRKPSVAELPNGRESRPYRIPGPSTVDVSLDQLSNEKDPRPYRMGVKHSVINGLNQPLNQREPRPYRKVSFPNLPDHGIDKQMDEREPRPYRIPGSSNPPNIDAYSGSDISGLIAVRSKPQEPSQSTSQASDLEVVPLSVEYPPNSMATNCARRSSPRTDRDGDEGRGEGEKWQAASDDGDRFKPSSSPYAVDLNDARCQLAFVLNSAYLVSRREVFRRVATNVFGTAIKSKSLKLINGQVQWADDSQPNETAFEIKESPFESRLKDGGVDINALAAGQDYGGPPIKFHEESFQSEDDPPIQMPNHTFPADSQSSLSVPSFPAEPITAMSIDCDNTNSANIPTENRRMKANEMDYSARPGPIQMRRPSLTSTESAVFGRKMNGHTNRKTFENHSANNRQADQESDLPNHTVVCNDTDFSNVLVENQLMTDKFGGNTAVDPDKPMINRPNPSEPIPVRRSSMESITSASPMTIARKRSGTAESSPIKTTDGNEAIPYEFAGPIEHGATSKSMNSRRIPDNRFVPKKVVTTQFSLRNQSIASPNEEVSTDPMAVTTKSAYGGKGSEFPSETIGENKKTNQSDDMTHSNASPIVTESPRPVEPDSTTETLKPSKIYSGPNPNYYEDAEFMKRMGIKNGKGQFEGFRSSDDLPPARKADRTKITKSGRPTSSVPSGVSIATTSRPVDQPKDSKRCETCAGERTSSTSSARSHRHAIKETATRLLSRSNTVSRTGQASTDSGRKAKKTICGIPLRKRTNFKGKKKAN